MRAFVLMTALPPTLGHMHLIEFAAMLAPVTVIVSTQPSEPYTSSRYFAIVEAMQNKGLHPNIVGYQHYNEIIWANDEIEQNPDTPGFFDMWRERMIEFGVTPNSDDIIVSSEPYGQKLADITGTTFMPYDMERSIYYSKATNIRENPLSLDNWYQMIPEFRKKLIQRITIFGAESTGKTTLSKALAGRLDGQWLFEYARPYLENTVNEITERSMTAIWKGQKALQQHATYFVDSPFIIQDTDLFSTVGYWDMWSNPEHNMHPGSMTPTRLEVEAYVNRSDLYIVTPSNIPFEADPLRYGGDKREGSDDYWIDVLEKFGLKYEILGSNRLSDRIEESVDIITEHFNNRVKLSYDRKGY